MNEMILYSEIEKANIEVNNNCKLKMEFVKGKTSEKQYLKVTRIDEKGNEYGTRFINEGDLVLLWNRYVYCKDNNEEIM